MARRVLIVALLLAIAAVALVRLHREPPPRPREPFAFTCPAPAPSPPALAEPAPAVGVNTHLLRDDTRNATRCALLDRLTAAGVTWLRLDLRWSEAQPRDPASGDRFADSLDRGRLARLGSTVDAARARGLRVLVVVFATPQWASGGPVESAGPPLDAAGYGRFLGFLASRYRGRVDAWQVWNEPNESTFFDADGEASFSAVDAAAYATLLRRAAPAVRRGDPDALVVLGGPSYNNVPWLELIYAQGVRGLFDVMAVQPYSIPSCRAPEVDDGSIYVLPAVSRVRALMERVGDGALPIWFTEFGWSSHANPPLAPDYRLGVPEQAQGDYLVRTLVLLRERYPYVEAAFWYRDRDAVIDGQDPTEAAHLGGFGLLRRDLAAKPAYRTLRAYLLTGTVPGRRDAPCPDAAGA
ncbi:MAG TPA: cellulase family glycosylhydrolase [Actinomycetota bacterium]|nr:cellulase family glycosylhydrolase [Actinomycetota bacterium]